MIVISTTSASVIAARNLVSASDADVAITIRITSSRSRGLYSAITKGATVACTSHVFESVKVDIYTPLWLVVATATKGVGWRCVVKSAAPLNVIYVHRAACSICRFPYGNFKRSSSRVYLGSAANQRSLKLFSYPKRIRGVIARGSTFHWVSRAA